VPYCQRIKATSHAVCEPRRLLRLLRLLRVAQLLFNSPAAAAGIPSFVNRAWVALAQILYSAGFLINLLGCLWCAAVPNVAITASSCAHHFNELPCQHITAATEFSLVCGTR